MSMKHENVQNPANTLAGDHPMGIRLVSKGCEDQPRYAT